MNKQIKQILKGKVVVNCRTFEECTKYLNWAKSKGITWKDQGTDEDNVKEMYLKLQDYTCYKVYDNNEMKVGNLRMFIRKNYSFVQFTEIEKFLLIPIEKGDIVKFKDFVKAGKVYYGIDVRSLGAGSGIAIGRNKHSDSDSIKIRSKDDSFIWHFPEAILEVVKPAEKKDNPLDPVQIEVKTINSLQRKQLIDAITALGGKIYFGNNRKVTKAQIVCYDKEYVGTSSCCSSDIFNQEFGEYLALWRAFNKLTCSEINKWEKGIK